MKASAGLIERNRKYGAALRGAFAVADGGRAPRAECTDESMQNPYYKGHTSAVEVTNLLVFGFFGELIHAAVNYPGSWRYTRLASVSGLHRDCLPDDHTPPGFAILGDSALVSDLKLTSEKALRGRKCSESDGMPEPAALASIDLALQKAMLSERQSAEWGARALEGPFARLNIPLQADSRQRKMLLQACCHLLNFRARHAGLNHARAAFAGRHSVT
eukprot:Plantae.Rhodophyta-Hildenbrandia_rubra.ctg40010.p1 GENE.Plantae.Rhodophyta-Hildenbrandia_rubra.ctg40010~~Plantae.Rhodophyta-Hildenbrandia_rubra.ctg40010.p1  ORF type:complete len:233 (-),score=12.26 Plantae.Rhodophyta-Hildenbrandia_rubra.ctg40010:660-1310(-)